MNTRSVWMSRSVPAVLVIGLLAVPEAYAHGGGHGGGRTRCATSASVIPQQNYRAPQMARAAADVPPAPPRCLASDGSQRGPAIANNMLKPTTHMTRNANAQARANNAQSRNLNAQARPSASSQATTSPTHRPSAEWHLGDRDRDAVWNVRAGARQSIHNRRSPNDAHQQASTASPNAYTYGYGAGARSYQAYGYGRGYRNRSYGSRYGYGRSQGNNRALVSRLRAVHSSLARIDHDYQGHRVRAMHAISMAVRQLAHRSMGSNNMRNMGFASGVNNRQAMGMRRGGLGAGAGAGRRQPMTQAQSDSRMSQDLRVLQGINMQLSNQGNSTMGHAGASGHVQRAIRELNIALSIR